MKEVIFVFISSFFLTIAIGSSCNKQGPYGTTDYTTDKHLKEIHRQHAICYYFEGHTELSCIERIEDYE
jgi:hypothetical protein